MQIIPIASGKGGVGKSLIAANLAIALAGEGQRVVLCDLDLGGSNLHIFLGFRRVERGIGTFCLGRGVKFPQIIYPTDYTGLRFIPGDAQIPSLANLSHAQLNRIIRHLMALETDFLVLDLGAGTNFNTLDLFLLSARGLLVLNPNLVSIVSAYFFLKNVLLRLLYAGTSKGSTADLYLKTLRKNIPQLQQFSLTKQLDKLRELEPEVFRLLKAKIERLCPRLVLNMVEDPKDTQRVERLLKLVKDNLGLNLEHLGIIYRDDLQNTALNAQIPILTYKPESVLAVGLKRIASRIATTRGLEDSPIDLEIAEDSFLLAAGEAEKDFNLKVEYIQELLHCGALTPGDLVETITRQQFEILKLKNENQLLKSKLAEAVRKGYLV